VSRLGYAGVRTATEVDDDRASMLFVCHARSLAEDAHRNEVTTLRTMSAQATNISTDSRLLSGDRDGATGPTSLDLQTSTVNHRTIEGRWSQGGQDPRPRTRTCEG
jgi:hypothetical protein